MIPPLAAQTVDEGSFEVTLEVVLLIAAAVLVLLCGGAFAWFVLRHADRDSEGGSEDDTGT
ncbi:MAG: hypothetical protein U0575_00195 [Phycisphaerales bacterium]|jgi:hypothetical protein